MAECSNKCFLSILTYPHQNTIQNRCGHFTFFFLVSSWLSISCNREQIVSGLLHHWLQCPYHCVLPITLLCSHCLLRSRRMLSRDYPQVVNSAQPERNHHVAPQFCGYVPRMPVKSCGTCTEMYSPLVRVFEGAERFNLLRVNTLSLVLVIIVTKQMWIFGVSWFSVQLSDRWLNVLIICSWSPVHPNAASFSAVPMTGSCPGKINPAHFLCYPPVNA